MSSLQPINPHAAAERPSVWRPINAHILHAARHAEVIQQSVVVVGSAVFAMHGDIELVTAFDEVKVVNGEPDLRLPGQSLRPCPFDMGIGAIAADPLGIEQAYAEHEIADGAVRTDPQPDF